MSKIILDIGIMTDSNKISDSDVFFGGNSTLGYFSIITYIDFCTGNRLDFYFFPDNTMITYGDNGYQEFPPSGWKNPESEHLFPDEYSAV